MDNAYLVIIKVMVLFMYLIPGYILGKTKLVDTDLPKGLATVLLYIASPMLIIGACMRQFEPNIFMRGMLLMLVMAVIMFSQYYVSRLLYKNKPKNKQNVLTFALTFGNYGFMGIPILNAVFGDMGVIYGTFSIIIFNVLQWTLGTRCYTDDKKQMNVKKMFFNIGIISGVIGLVLFILPVKYPEVLIGGVKEIGAMTAPLSMIMIGLTLSKVKVKELVSGSEIYFLALIKMVAYPIIVAFILWLLKLPSVLIGVASITMAMPAATSTTMFALRLDGNVEFASKVVMLTVIFSIFSIPLLLYVKATFFPYLF